MGTEVQFKSHMTGYYSMRDLNEDANGYSNWPPHYRDRPHLPNGQFSNFSRPSATADSCIDYDRDALKQKMLEHEAIFRKQVYELHRLYRIQRDLMNEIRRNELPSSSLASRNFLHEDARIWQSPGFLSNYVRPSISGSEASCSPMKSLTGNNSLQASPLTQNGCTSKVPEWLESRPSKVRRRIIDLTLPADKYINPDELESSKGESYDQEDRVVADLNQPIQFEDTNVPLHSQHTESNRGGSVWLTHVVDAGQGNGDLKNTLQSKLHEIPMHLPAHTRNQHKASLTFDWERPSCSLSQKSRSVEACPCPDSYSIHHRTLQPAPLGQGMLGERWHQSNGFFSVASSSGTKVISYCSDVQNRTDAKPSVAVDLNRVLSDGEESQEDPLAVLPWLKPRTCQKDEATSHIVFDVKVKNSFQSGAKQSMGRSELDESSRHTKSDCEIAEGGRNMRMLDINLPCNEVPELNEEPSTKNSGLKCEIDLNSCAYEDETFLSNADERNISIDLEAPAYPEIEKEEEIFSENGKVSFDETKIAAEAIVAISSADVDLPEPSSAETLKWFAGIALRERKAREFDYFECMTLKLTEMKDEEHLPKPLAPPETLRLREEESAAAATSAANHRPQRRGGRQRRDFQRDILPGLTSLSRLEVMEDMQTFGGLMRAMGHAWNCGPTRRGSARKRPRRRRKVVAASPSPAASSPACTPPVSLTGWGKTKRTRRNRCLPRQ